MAFKSATGGGVVLTAPTVIPVGKWSGSWQTEAPNVTQSDCGGATLFFPTNQNNSWSFSVVRDDTAFPEAIGFASGTILPTLFLKLGAGAKGDKLTNTTVTGIETVCDTESNEVVRVTVSGKGGLLTTNQTIA